MWAGEEMGTTGYAMEERVHGEGNAGTIIITTSSRAILPLNQGPSLAIIVNSAIRIREAKSATVCNYVYTEPVSHYACKSCHTHSTYF